MSRPRLTVNFVCGEAFPAADPVARYVMRLSLALGDLRTSLLYQATEDLEPHQRVYFVRSMCVHTHELVLLFQGGDAIPDREFLFREIGGNESEVVTLRRMHRAVRRAMGKRLPASGLSLSAEVARIRHGFSHYHHSHQSDEMLAHAMQLVAGQQTAYVVGARAAMRARYADEVAERLLAPYPDNALPEHLPEVHDGISEMLGKAAQYAQQVEAMYLLGRMRSAVTVEGEGVPDHWRKRGG